MKKKLSLFIFLLLSLNRASLAQPVPDNADGRLWRLCKVWGYMKYYSPRTCEIQWDSLLRATIPLVKNAADNAAFNNHIQDMLDFVGQIPPAQATVPTADTNLNLQLAWTDDPVFTTGVRSFLDSFKSRAGRNDAIDCKVRFNDFSIPGYYSYIDFFTDTTRISMVYTEEADRLNVLFNYWNRFNYFGPYRNLNDQHWDTTLLQAIPEFIAVTTRQAFELELGRINTYIDDSHAFFQSAYFLLALGFDYPAIRLSRIENKIVVTKVADTITGIAVGDVLTALNGVPVENRIAELRNFVAASNEGVFYRDALNEMLRGPAGGRDYTFLNAAGQPYTKTLWHNLSNNEWLTWRKYEGPAWDTLCNGYGYVNMEMLTRAQVPDMYAALKDREAIVFDVRNYPNQTLWQLAPLFFHGPFASAKVFRPELREPGRYNIISDSVDIGSWNNPDPYSGKLFFLVNQETQSEAEYTVQCLSHAPGAKVIGSQTAGADGNFCYAFPLNNIYTAFTALGWYYKDGYQCQRNGIRIDEVVTPTIAGMREGKDEVLDYVTNCVTGIAPAVKSRLQVQVYPNPVSDMLSLDITLDRPEEATVQLTDVMGKVCYRQTLKAGRGTGRHSLNLEHLPAGMYFLDIRTGHNGARVLKLMKQ